jgi:imidazolonepropionase-like amidohydrolase
VPDLAVTFHEPVARMGARAAEDARRTLLGGVTSAREVGGLGIDLAAAIDDGSLVGPTIYGAGKVLSTTGGHADAHGYPLDFVTSSPAWLGEVCDGVPSVLRAVRLQLRRGARVIKVCASGGVMSQIDHPVHQQFSDEELAAIVAEAARAERVVAAHCHGKPGIMAALRAGVRTIEHGSYLDDEAAALMVETGAVYVPTRFVVHELQGMEAVLPPYAYRKATMIAERHEMALKTAVAAGVTMAMGTDIFFSGDRYGRNSREIRHFVDAGLTPLEAIEAATANGPLTLGPQAPRSGMLAVGHDADVIAVDTDPLTDLSVWGDPDRVTHVWKAGALLKHPA